jgi:hypothetical protein
VSRSGFWEHEGLAVPRRDPGCKDQGGRRKSDPQSPAYCRVVRQDAAWPVACTVLPQPRMASSWSLGLVEQQVCEALTALTGRLYSRGECDARARDRHVAQRDQVAAGRPRVRPALPITKVQDA